jgi:phosphoglycolate phosphatase-like HAD superfamily hydrolase
VRLLALDFDGVISDSAPEAFVVALHTWRALCPERPLAPEWRAGRDGPTPARAEVTAQPLYAGFIELMALGNRAEDYAVMLDALEAHARLPDQAAYDAWRDRLPREWLRAFHKAFYKVRAALSDADPAGWTALMGPYPEVPAILRRHAREVVLAIATAKDRRSVARLLRGYGIDDLFSEGRVLDKEAGVSKAEHLALLHERFGVPYPEITFVEDKVNHLDGAARLGVRCALAAWGYNGPREIVQARARGYLVCSLADVEVQIFGSAPDLPGGFGCGASSS